MSFLSTKVQRPDHSALHSHDFYDAGDAVIIGSGISGAIIAAELTRAGKRVLVVEAATDAERTFTGYLGDLNQFYTQPSRGNQSPFPINPNAAMPRGDELRKLAGGETNAAPYVVQSGPYVTDTVYSKAFGGTTIHWEAKTPRMLPEDFSLQSLYGQGADWPIAYGDMTADYEAAEREIGVSADRGDQEYGGVKFSDGYVFPMHGLPLSYLDQQVDKGIKGTSVDLYGKRYPVKVRPYPQGRNSIPNKAYDGGKGYGPQGVVALHQIELGERCQGNTNCVPICPVQARYHSGKTMARAFSSRTGRAELQSQAVASKVLVDHESGRVSGVEIKLYHDPASPSHDTVTVRAKIYVVAGNAIETPRLLLASGLPSTSGLVGRNLMDHAYLLSWALMPQPCGTMRGTSSTGGIVDLRVGPFRRHQAAFAVDIHNDGWGWATGAPESDLRTLVDQYNKFGKDLREALIRRVSSQLMFAFMIEVPPEESNRVSVSPRYVDPLGNMRPIVSFSAPENTLRGASYARQFARLVFSRLGAEDYTAYDPDDYGFVSYGDETFALRGGNHLAGTHVMGSNPATSVVTTDQRSWDHENLYLVGAGSMPTVGTANITLTLAALCYRSARAMLRQLGAS